MTRHDPRRSRADLEFPTVPIRRPTGPPATSSELTAPIRRTASGVGGRRDARLDPPTARIVTDIGRDPDDLPTEHLSLAAVVAAREAPAAKPAARGGDVRGENVRRSALQLVVAGGILPLVSLATGPLLAYFLGVEGRGHLSAVVAVIFLMPFLLAVGTTDAATYLVARRKQPVATVALTFGTTQALVGVVAAAGVWLLAPIILADYPAGIPLLRLAGLTLIPAMALRAVAGARIGEGRYDLLVAERWIAGLGKLALLIVLALGGVLTVATATWSQVGILVIAQLVVLIGLTRPRVRRRQVRVLAGAGYGYGAKSWGGELSNVLVWRLDQVVLLPLAGAAQLGYYAVAVSLAEVPRMLLNDLRNILLAEVASSGDAHAAARACRMSVVAITAPVLVFMALTPFVLPLLFSQAFAPAVPMAEVLLVATIPIGANMFIAGSISALGRPGLQSWARVIGVVVVVVGLAVLAPIFGGLGAAWTTLAAALAVTGVLVFAFWRITGRLIQLTVSLQLCDQL